MASSDDKDGSIVETTSTVGSDRVETSAPLSTGVIEIGPKSIPAHLSSTGSKGNGVPSHDSTRHVLPAVPAIGDASRPSSGPRSISSRSPSSIDEDGTRSSSAPSAPMSSTDDRASKSTTSLGFGTHRSPEPKSSTALGFGPHRSPEPKISTAPGFGAPRSPAPKDIADDDDRAATGAASSRDQATDAAPSRDQDTPARDTPRFTREALRSSSLARMGSSLRRAFRFAFREPRSGLWSMLVVVCAMIVVGVTALAAKHVDAWTMRPGDGGSMVVYLGENVDDATAGKLVTELRGLPGVQHAELVPAEESAKRLQQALGGDASLMEGVDIGALPASVEVTLAPGVREVVAMSPTVKALRGAPGVEDVVLDEASEDRTTAALGTVRTVVWTGAALLAGLALLIALATIRLRLDRDSEEQRISHMLGAGPSFFVTPSIAAGMIIGALAALIAGVAIAGALHAYGDAIVAALSGPLGAIEMAMPTLVELAMFVGLGAALGVVGGGLAGAARVAR